MFRLILLFLIFFTSVICLAQTEKNIHQFPIPDKTPLRLFYLQRSLNKNTIVYDACFDEKGNLNCENPVNIYWIRYEEKGQIMQLRYLDRYFAFGVSAEKLNNSNFNYKVTLVSFDKRSFYIKQIAPFKAVAYTMVNGKYLLLDHIFIQSDPDGLLTRAEYLEIYGSDQQTSKMEHERIIL